MKKETKEKKMVLLFPVYMYYPVSLYHRNCRRAVVNWTDAIKKKKKTQFKSSKIQTKYKVPARLGETQAYTFINRHSISKHLIIVKHP